MASPLETEDQYTRTRNWRDKFHQGGKDAHKYTLTHGEITGKMMRESQWSMRDDLQQQMDEYDDLKKRSRTPPWTDTDRQARGEEVFGLKADHIRWLTAEESERIDAGREAALEANRAQIEKQKAERPAKAQDS